MSATAIWTIGHSTQSIDDFIAALSSQKISTLADVRRFPGSRRHPQFNRPSLSESLSAVGITYVHLRELGGRRPANPNSRNTGLRNEGFRGYADYMESNSFREGIDRLLELAAGDRTAIMCAEALWWRCHRSLISDYLLSKSVEVIHILNSRKTEAHRYTSAATIIDGELKYPGLL
jgi:uncharacterized protein (DUF488 family)